MDPVDLGIILSNITCFVTGQGSILQYVSICDYKTVHGSREAWKPYMQKVGEQVEDYLERLGQTFFTVS